MSDYDATIREINQAKSLEQIERIVGRFVAQAPAISEAFRGRYWSASYEGSTAAWLALADWVGGKCIECCNHTHGCDHLMM